MLITIIFFLLPFCIFAEEKSTIQEAAHSSKKVAEIKVQKDEKRIVVAEKNITTSVKNGSHKISKTRGVEHQKVQVLHKEKGVNIDRQNTNFRVAKATEWNAYATIAIAILTIILAIETVRLRLIQAKQITHLSDEAIKPKIELFLETNKYAINFLEIHLVNNGNGTANNIKFFFQPENNEAIETSKRIIAKIEKINFFKIGLRYLGAGQLKKSFLMSAIEREFGGDDKFFKSIINAKIICEDDLGKEYIYKYTINMSEFQGIRSIGQEPTKEMAESLKKICDNLTSIITLSAGKKRIQADIYDNVSREREEQELREWMEEQKKI